MAARNIIKHQKDFMLQVQVTRIIWKLTDNTLGYLMEQFYTYTTDIDLDNRTQTKSLMPSNLPGLETLDDFLKNLLEENHKALNNNKTSFIKTFSKIFWVY